MRLHCLCISYWANASGHFLAIRHYRMLQRHITGTAIKEFVL
uniref:Uncharacterized protein n=1 Tax=Anguilla anguilla TaxID=7936 RepID=A0A0E9PD73_ANGAN